MGVLSWILRLLWFFLPVALANMAPVLVKQRLAWLAKPIDGGTMLFGNHKTWRGLGVAPLLPEHCLRCSGGPPCTGQCSKQSRPIPIAIFRGGLVSYLVYLRFWVTY